MAYEKTDIVTQRMEGGAHWLVENWQKAGLALAALAVAGILAALVTVSLKKTRIRAWETLATAQMQAYQGKLNDALGNIEQILANNRSGDMVCQAYLLKGDVLMQNQKPAEAVDAYQHALRQARTAELKALSLAGLGAAQEESQKWDEAAATYAQLAKEHPESFLAPRAWESLGRIQLFQKKWGDAQGTFEKLVTLYPASLWAKQAQEFLAQLKGQPAATPPSK